MADPPDSRGQEPASRSPRLVRWLLTAARLLMVIGIAAILAASGALLVVAAAEAYRIVASLLRLGGQAGIGKDELMLASVKLVDLVLLATVLHIVAIGLYELFIDSRIPVPAWLRISTVDDLKHKLIGVVVTLLAVVFLEQAIAWDGSRDLLPLGVGIGAVVAALSYFLGVRPAKADAETGP